MVEKELPTGRPAGDANMSAVLDGIKVMYEQVGTIPTHMVMTHSTWKKLREEVVDVPSLVLPECDASNIEIHGMKVRVIPDDIVDLFDKRTREHLKNDGIRMYALPNPSADIFKGHAPLRMLTGTEPRERKSWKFSTTIKQVYLDMKLKDHKRKGYFVEYKEDTPFWNARLPKLQGHLNRGETVDGVFLTGQKVTRVRIVGIRLETSRMSIPKRYLGAISTQAHWELNCVLVKEAETDDRC